eukprot:g19523.t1
MSATVIAPSAAPVAPPPVSKTTDVNLTRKIDTFAEDRLEAVAARLVALILAYLPLVLVGGIAGLVIGLVEEAAGRGDSSAAATAPSPATRDKTSTFALYWYRGVYLLLLNVIWQPTTDLTLFVAIFTSVCGAVVTLCLFGIVYEKFSERAVPMKFGEHLMLSRAPEQLALQRSQNRHRDMGVLTFRYANLNGENLLEAQVSACVIQRFLGPDGDGTIFQTNLPIATIPAERSPGIPSALFLHHILDDESPLVSAPVEHSNHNSPLERITFGNCLRIFLTVSGTAGTTLEATCGGADWGPSSVVIDGKFRPLRNQKTWNELQFEALNAFDVLPFAARIARRLPEFAAETDERAEAEVEAEIRRKMGLPAGG